MAPKRKPLIEERQLGRWRLLREFNGHLATAMEGASLHRSWESPQRQLELVNYLSLFLLGVFNPVVTSMRGLA